MFCIVYHKVIPVIIVSVRFFNWMKFYLKKNYIEFSQEVQWHASYYCQAVSIYCSILFVCLFVLQSSWCSSTCFLSRYLPIVHLIWITSSRKNFLVFEECTNTCQNFECIIYLEIQIILCVSFIVLISHSILLVSINTVMIAL